MGINIGVTLSLVVAAYDKYAACGARDGGIPRDSQAVISNVLQIYPNKLIIFAINI